MKKIMKSILTLIIAVVGVFALGVKAEAPSSLKITGKTLINPIGSMHFYKKSVTYNNKTVYVYCIDLDKKSSPSTGTTIKKSSSELNAGYAYIINNGYPYDNHSNMSATERYGATQVAMWWYVDYLNGIENKVTPRSEYKNSNGNSYDPLQNFKNGSYKNTNVYKMAYSLKEGAKKASYAKPSIKLNITDKNMTLSSDKKYYVSSQIGVNSSGISGNYTVTLNSAPSGTIVTDVKGNKKTSFSAGDKFIVKVPVASYKELTNKFTITVNASGTVNKAYKYTASNSLQSLVANFPEVIKVSNAGQLIYTTTKVKISKIDIASGQNLPGAKLEVKDANGNIVASWTTSDTDYYIENLAAGKYTLTETAAPDGYILSTEVVEFEVKADGTVISVTMYNAPEEQVVEEVPEAIVTETVVVPDTASTASTIMYIVGAIIIIVGTGFVIKNVKTEKTNK